MAAGVLEAECRVQVTDGQEHEVTVNAIANGSQWGDAVLTEGRAIFRHFYGPARSLASFELTRWRLSVAGEYLQRILAGGNTKPLLDIAYGRVGEPIPPAVDVLDDPRVSAAGQANASIAMAQATVSVGDTTVNNQVNVTLDPQPLADAVREAVTAASSDPAPGGQDHEPPIDGAGAMPARGAVGQEQVVSFLRSHHPVGGEKSLAGKDIATKTGASPATVTRALKAVFGPEGHAAYIASCQRGDVAAKLAQHDGDGLSFGTTDPAELDRIQ